MRRKCSLPAQSWASKDESTFAACGSVGSEAARGVTRRDRGRPCSSWRAEDRPLLRGSCLPQALMLWGGGDFLGTKALLREVTGVQAGREAERQIGV